MIGIFDSGVGGLSVFREVRKLLPEESYIYYSDNAHCPYGEKSVEYIIGRAREITSFLIGKGAEIIVVACNTATAAAISTLRAEFPIKFIGMEPAVKPAVKSTKTGVVGVLATAGTLKADKYLHTREKFSEGVKIVEHIGHGFVELVEKGCLTGNEAENIVKESLKPLLDEGADRIVLGCTHYPLLRSKIMKYFGETIHLVNPAYETAMDLKQILEEKYGIKVLHHTEIYDAGGVNGAYERMNEGVSKIIEETTEGLKEIYQKLFPERDIKEPSVLLVQREF
jgi:glutamate racemase